MTRPALRPKIIFVGGSHGVGKTAICESLCPEFAMEHHSASELISKLRDVQFTSKRTDNITGNQDSLIAAIDAFLNYDTNYLLDGHFCLIDKNEAIVKIPLSTYKAMAPAAIILLHDDPIKIHSRLMKRDEENFNLGLIRSLQDEEVLYSKTIASELAIPYLQANPFTDRELVHNFVRNLLKGERF